MLWHLNGMCGKNCDYGNNYYFYYYNRLTAFFQDNLGKPAPERQIHSGF